jgi:Trk K+ transport system NAD-binding subunit
MKITIIGLGLIGGSIAKTLSRFKDNQILLLIQTKAASAMQ